MREPWLLAFTTASSEAALPLALRNLEAFGVPQRVASFVLPTGYAFNMDGTALYLSLAVLFVAQAAGIELPLGQQLLMLLTLMLTSKGLAAVPRASLVVLTAALAQFGLPLEGVALIVAWTRSWTWGARRSTSSATVSRPSSWRGGRAR